MSHLIITLEDLREFGSKWREFITPADEMPDDDIRFVGYYYIDELGDKRHTWDYEESIGE